MKYKVFFYLLLLGFVSCKKSEILDPLTDQLFNQKFDAGLIINGHEFDSLLIEGCTFTNKPVDIANCDNLIIRNCTFKNTKGNSIQIGRNGDCTGIIIENCSFMNVGYMGVDLAEKTSNCVIRNCTFEKIAQSQVGSAMGEPHHSIYNRGPNVLIENNFFQAEQQPGGNVISTRSSGIIRNNIILNGPQNGINYFGDHPGGDSLVIENNFIYNSYFSGILLAGKEGKNDWHNKNIVVRFNTIAVSKNSSIFVDGKFENSANIPIYGNILVNSTGSYFKTFYTLPDVHTNLKSESDIGFVDMSSGDLHLMPNSEAIGFANGLTDFPLLDIDGDLRNQSTLNAGADEF